MPFSGPLKTDFSALELTRRAWVFKILSRGRKTGEEDRGLFGFWGRKRVKSGPRKPLMICQKRPNFVTFRELLSNLKETMVFPVLRIRFP